MIEMGRVEKPLAGAFFSPRKGILLRREEIQWGEPFEDLILSRLYQAADQSNSLDPIQTAPVYLLC